MSADLQMTITSIEPAPIRIVAGLVYFSSIDEFLQAETKHGFQFKFKSKGKYYEFSAVLGESTYKKLNFPVQYHTLEKNVQPDSDREPDLLLVPLRNEQGLYADETVDEGMKILRVNTMLANALRREVQGSFEPDAKLVAYDNLVLENLYISNYKPYNKKTVFDLEAFLATPRNFVLCPQFGMVKPVNEEDPDNREYKIYVKLGLHGVKAGTPERTNYSAIVRQNNKIERKRKAMEQDLPPKTLREQVEEYTRDQASLAVPEAAIVSEIVVWVTREYERVMNPSNSTL